MNGHRDSLGRSARGFDPSKPAGGAGGDILREDIDTTGAAGGRTVPGLSPYGCLGTRRDPLAIPPEAA
ncbi:MAG: hypothetical protein ABUL47_07425 [Leifsonia sp.]